jgi:vacuolar-type H+-ATPase subunit I/STV1
VIQVLRSDKLRGFKIEIETDSTIQPNADAEKAARTELITAIGGASQQLAAGVQAGIISQDVAKELFAFGMRAFKAGTAMDEALDAMGPSDGMSQAQQQKEQELQAREQQVAQAEQQAKDITHKAQLATKDAQMAGDRVKSEKEVFDLQQKFAADVQQIREDFEKLASRVMDHAETSVREVSKNMQQPQGVM